MNVIALSDYMAAAADRRSVFGRYDCVRFVVEAMRVGWGRDYLHVLGYCDRRSAVDRLRAAGGLYEAFCDALGQDIPATDLRPGDIAWFPDPAVGLVLPNDIVVVKAYRSVFRLPISESRSGWRTDGTVPRRRA